MATTRSYKEISDEILTHELMINKLYKERNAAYGRGPLRLPRAATFILEQEEGGSFKVTTTKMESYGSKILYTGEAVTDEGKTVIVSFIEDVGVVIRFCVNGARFDWYEKQDGYANDGSVNTFTIL
jgi:hypothetical protein